MTDHDARAPDSFCQDLVVVRQSLQLVTCFLVEIAEARRGDAGRHSVRLGEDDIKCDRHGAKLGEFCDKIGDNRARPRPLTDVLQARFVEVYDDNRPRRSLTREQALIEVEGPQPDFLERQRVEDAQWNKREQEQDADRSCETEASRPTSQHAHVRGLVTSRGTPA